MLRKMVALAALALMLTTGAHAMTADEETQLVTGQCATSIRSMDPRFDAYFDNVTSQWHTFGTPAEIYYFDKCLMEHGQHISP